MNTILADAVVVSGGSNSFIHAILFLIIVGIIIGILLWVISAIPLIPGIIKQVLTWVLYLVAAIILINFLLSLVGHGFIAID